MTMVSPMMIPRESGLEDDEDFDGFHENEDLTSEAYCRTMGILMGFTSTIILLERLTRHIYSKK